MRIVSPLVRGYASPLWIVFVAVFSLLVSVGVSHLLPPRQPKVHDEFSYLLAADTFASGRLTNPPLPFPKPFATIHVLVRPTYASKYPPGQGLFLALGKVIAGDFIVGAWISIALACAAVVWALRAWVGPGWALLGGIIAAANPLVVSWANNYWGGGVAMLGGALFIGALRRVACPKPRFWDAALGGTGIAVMAFSRPAEGAMLTLVGLAILGTWLVRERHQSDFAIGPWFARLVAGVAGPLILAVAFMLLYDRAVTGSPFTMPYMLYTREHDSIPLFRFQNNFPLHTYDNPAIQRYYDVQAMLEHVDRSSPIREVVVLAANLGFDTRFYLLCPIILLGLLVAALRFRRTRDFWARAAIVGFVTFQIPILAETYAAAHYVAPAIALGMAAALLALQDVLSAWRAVGKRAIPLIGLCTALLAVITIGLWIPGFRILSQNRQGWPNTRAAIESDLRKKGGKHMIFVRYDPLDKHDPANEWVYNRAEIDTAPVLWAHDLGPTENAPVVDYYKDRSAWLLIVDSDNQVKLSPYDAKTAALISQTPQTKDIPSLR